MVSSGRGSRVAGRGAGVADGGGVRKNKRRASSVIGLIETRASFGGSSEKPVGWRLVRGHCPQDTSSLRPDRGLPHSSARYHISILTKHSKEIDYVSNRL